MGVRMGKAHINADVPRDWLIKAERVAEGYPVGVKRSVASKAYLDARYEKYDPTFADHKLSDVGVRIYRSCWGIGAYDARQMYARCAMQGRKAVA